MATMNVSLPDQMKAWVEDQVASGRYANASDYIRDIIRREQDIAARRAELQALIREGIESGPPRPFDAAQFLAGMQADHGG